MLSKKYNFQAVQIPVATYRIHKNNFSLRNRKLEVNEYKYWFKKNEKQFNTLEREVILKKIANIEFKSYKFEKNFSETINYFIKKKKYLLSIKNIAILISPRFILEKYMLFA